MKMKRLSTLALLLLTVLLVSPLSVRAEPDEVYINVLHKPRERTVRPDQTVILYGRWGACSPGLVRMFMTASDIELTLDEAVLLGPEEVRELWGEPGSPEPWAFCMGRQDILWAYWYHPLGTLELGTYELVTTVALNHPVHDGADYDLDGSPDQVPAGHWLHKEITIIVEE
jgi:hypothetical protein